MLGARTVCLSVTSTRFSAQTLGKADMVRSRPAKDAGTPGGAQSPRRGPTIEDVAAVAGVSRGTVSRALNGGRYVSSAAQAAVQRAVLETGYVVNQSARSLVTRRSGCVAFVLSEPREKLTEDPNFGVLIRACTQALAAYDLHLIPLIAGSWAEREQTLAFLRGGHADGALLISTHRGDPILAELKDNDLPIVACGKPLGHEAMIPYVGADDRGGAQQMVRYLVEQGRERIATITGPLDTPGGLERLEGYCDVVGRTAAKRLIANGDYSRRSGEEAMARLLGQSPKLDAVFVASDLMAAGALAHLRRAGLRVPDDVAVGGFDDSPVAASTDPPLTTIRQPLERVAAEMVRYLVAAIDGSTETEAVALPTELVRRESA